MRKRLLRLYPAAWRERYGEEMSALLDEAPPSVTAALDLLRGAIAAHLRPLAVSSPAARMRATVGRVLGCFVVFCFLGAGFTKTTENYSHTERLHPLLGVSHAVILVAAIVGAASLALAAAPLAIASLAEARRARDPSLWRLIAAPPAAIAIFAGSVGLFGLWLKPHHLSSGAGGWLLLGFWILCGAVAAFTCWAAPRAIMRRAELPLRAFAVALPAIALVAASMIAVAIAMGAYLIGIVADAPQLGSVGNGPGSLIDVSTSIAIQFAGMLALSACAVLSSTRGVRALRTR